MEKWTTNEENIQLRREEISLGAEKCSENKRKIKNK